MPEPVAPVKETVKNKVEEKSTAPPAAPATPVPSVKPVQPAQEPEKIEDQPSVPSAPAVPTQDPIKTLEPETASEKHEIAAPH